MLIFTLGVKEVVGVRFRFEDDDLERLYSDRSSRHPRLGADLTKQFRKAMQLIVAAKDERDLRNYRGLRLEKLDGKRQGQHSVRLNDQFRLILRFETDGEGRIVTVVELTDYH
jgi:proteic killer suppression protein